MIDARGYSCPEPVIMAQKALATGEAKYEMLVDSKTAVENVSYYVKGQGYTVEVVPGEGEFTLVFTKSK